MADMTQAPITKAKEWLAALEYIAARTRAPPNFPRAISGRAVWRGTSIKVSKKLGQLSEELAPNGEELGHSPSCVYADSSNWLRTPERTADTGTLHMAVRRTRTPAVGDSRGGSNETRDTVMETIVVGVFNQTAPAP